LPIDEVAANRAVAILDRLRLPDVPGRPLLRDAMGDWFRDIVRLLHGSVDPDTGERMIRELFLLVPKKNSKTTYGGALMLASLLINERPSAEFLLVAPSHMIAEIAFKVVEGMIAADATLTKASHVQPHLKKVTWLKTGATLQVKSFNPAVLTGVKPAGVLVDELHVVSTDPNADRVIGQLRGGMISQPESFLLFITTQSERQPAGVFKAELTKAREIRDGLRAGAMLPVLYEFPDDIASDRAQWENSANWPMVLPNLGRNVTIERLITEFQVAKDTGEDEFRRWASQHLNVEVGLGLRSDSWAGAQFWEACGDVSVTLEGLIERCEVVTCGIDGGGADDLMALGIIGREKGTRRWLHHGRAWAHPIALERRKEIAPRLRDFADQGHLTIVDRVGEDLDELVSIVKQLDASGVLADEGAIGVDPIGIGQVLDSLAEAGIDNLQKKRIVAVSQGWQLGRAIKTLERQLAEKSFTHGAQPLMAWAVGNAKIEQRANSILITKASSGSAKIDPVIAMLCAVDLMAVGPQARNAPSVYERRDLLMV
jgi:phage terminase large subunit-like protein